MNPEQALKLEAYLDGELSDREARHVSEWLAGDSEARLLFEELQMTKTVLAKNEPEIKLPESREFFWSKIEREISREATQPQRTPESVSIFTWLQRHLAPVAAGVAALLMAAFIGVQSLHHANAQVVAEGESLLDDMGMMTYRSEADQMTIVWLYDNTDSQVADTTSDATLEWQ